MDVISRSVDPTFWAGRRVLLTGHTGFKGSWLSLWLHELGAEVHGLGLEPSTQPALFHEARVGPCLATHLIGDIRDHTTVLDALLASQPEIVIHMAAQALVPASYQTPVQTYATNVMGTVHVLDAVRRVPSVRAIINVTTDKCYENKEWLWGYRETEPLGGRDPYSSSKACSELVSNAYRNSYFNPDSYGKEHVVALATARAGNVVGGGDWADDRIVPDILRAFQNGDPVVIRNPHATRPWQHVLEPLSGYLLLAENLFTEGANFAEPFNFGPDETDARPVQWIVEHMASLWGESASWKPDVRAHPHEALSLRIDCTKAKTLLNWQPRWRLDTALVHIVEWHRRWLAGDDMRDVCIQQIRHFMEKI